MASDAARPDPRVVASYLDDVELELDAVRRLLREPPNRFAAFHLQQAAEKLVKAVRLLRGFHATAGHNIEMLVDELPKDDPWRAKLAVFEPLSAYATTYRYPTPGGKRKPGPNDVEVLAWVEKIHDVAVELRAGLAEDAP